jgi:hypothetical protein
MAIGKISDASPLYEYTRAYSGPEARGTAKRDAVTEDTVALKNSAPQESAKNEGVKLSISDKAVDMTKPNAAGNKDDEVPIKTQEQPEEIIKNYPPFLEGSKERVQMLKSFAALRREIDDLTIPPDDDGSANSRSDEEKDSTATVPQRDMEGTERKISSEAGLIIASKKD